MTYSGKLFAFGISHCDQSVSVCSDCIAGDAYQTDRLVFVNLKYVRLLC